MGELMPLGLTATKKLVEEVKSVSVKASPTADHRRIPLTYAADQTADGAVTVAVTLPAEQSIKSDTIRVRANAMRLQVEVGDEHALDVYYPMTIDVDSLRAECNCDTRVVTIWGRIMK